MHLLNSRLHFSQFSEKPIRKIFYSFSSHCFLRLQIRLQFVAKTRLDAEWGLSVPNPSLPPHLLSPTSPPTPSLKFVSSPGRGDKHYCRINSVCRFASLVLGSPVSFSILQPRSRSPASFSVLQPRSRFASLVLVSPASFSVHQPRSLFRSSREIYLGRLLSVRCHRPVVCDASTAVLAAAHGWRAWDSVPPIRGSDRAEATLGIDESGYVPDPG